ncbi:MAG: Tetratricopeptide 1 repeat-containing protein [Caulobacter sp.]|nr:Tetratricopeptide 1 repeat-containing protein [Caulobacter sp.]
MPSTPDTTIETAPTDADRLVALAQGALARGKPDVAGSAAEAAIKLDPQRSDAWLLLCEALSKVAGPADVAKARAMALTHLAESDPVRAVFEAERALGLVRATRWEQAAEAAVLAASRSGMQPPAHRVLSAAYAEMGRHEDALRHAELAAAGLPHDASVQHALADALRILGRLEDADTAYARTLALDPDDALAHAALARLRPWTVGDNHLEALGAALSRATPGSPEATELGYALAKELDDIGRPAEAWAALSASAAAAGARNPYNAALEAARVDALVASFPRARVEAQTMHRPDGPRPIFIFGLPRSGTTLVERILSAHSTVAALGETLALPEAVKNAARTPGFEIFDIPTIRAAATANRAETARLYQQHIAHLTGAAPVVTDKLPDNYEYAGAIRLAFPEAPMVHVRRAPMDSLFGALRLPFAAGAYPWSYSLADLAAHYRAYRRLTDHWRQVLGRGFVEVSLERLIQDPLVETGFLLAGCGLAFEEACLAPERATGAVSTESAAQVRNPINAQGVGAWRRYAKQLEPLRAELERDGFVDANGDPV